MINKIKDREQLFNKFFDAFQVWFNKHYENKKIDRKIIIWDLFGGSNNSVWNALKDYDFIEVYTFDINTNIKHDKQYIINLGKENIDNFIEFIEMGNFPKPDFITASPLCNSFSVILQTPDGGTLGWKKEIIKDSWKYRGNHYEYVEDSFKIRDEQSFNEMKAKNNFFRYMEYEKIKNNAELGFRCMKNTIDIIRKYNPLCYYIENPWTSKIWDVFHYYSATRHKNRAHYNNYDLTHTQKPTCFLSNMRMLLNHENLKGNVEKRASKARSNVCFKGTSKPLEQGTNTLIPELLIKHIISLFLEEWKTRKYNVGNIFKEYEEHLKKKGG